MNESRASKLASVVVIALLLLGVTLQLAQYLFNRDLRLDEASFALNLMQKSHAELLGPMDYSQNSPMLFLMILKTFLVLFGYSEYALRFIPLINGIASLPLIYLLAYNISKPDPDQPWHAAFTRPAWTPALITLAFLAVNKHLIFFASDLRQYATNLVVVAVLYLYVIRPKLDPTPSVRSRNFMLGLIALGVLMTWLSLAAIFILGGIGATYVLYGLLKKDRKLLLWSSAASIIWIASFGVHYKMHDANIEARDMRGEMTREIDASTAPLPPTSLSDLKWYRETYEKAMYFPGGLTYHGLGIFVTLAGLIVLWKRNPAYALMLALPVAFALFASSFGKYPFKDRYIMFLLPMIVILIGEGVGLFVRQKEINNKAIGALLLLMLYIQPLAHGLRHITQPRTVSEIQPLLAHIRDNWQDNEVIFCTWFTAIPVKYYQPRYGITDDMLFLEPRDPHLVNQVWEYRAETIPTLHQHGNPYWLLIEDDTGPPIPTHINEVDDYGRQLEVIQSPGATLYLYEKP